LALGVALIVSNRYFSFVDNEVRSLDFASLPARTLFSRFFYGGGQLETSGLYARIRHPRYAAMFCAVLGACLIAGTRTLWIVAVVWWIVERCVIALEEREMLARFGEPYAQYRRRVPGFLRFRFRTQPRER